MALNETTNQKSVAQNRSLESEISRVASNPAIEPAYELDVLSQFKANIQQVEELNARLRFVLAEVQSLVKKS